MKHVNLLVSAATALILLTSCVTMMVPTPTSTPAPGPEPTTTPLTFVGEEALRGKAEPNSVLVRFVPGAPAASRDEARALANGKLDKKYKIVPGLEKLTVVDVPAAVQSLERLPYVMYAEPDYIVTIDQPLAESAGKADAAYAPDTFPNDPRYGELWGLASIDAPLAWDITTGDPDFVVAIIDTGIDYTHPDLAPNVWTNSGETPGNGIDDDGNGYVDDIHGYDFANNDGNPLDDHFHGTHVAGTIGAVGNNGAGVAGVNWRVKLMAVKFLAANGSGSTSGAISAVEYAARMRVRVSNNSWGGGGYSQALHDAIKNSQAIGHLFVAAAGNASRNLDFYPVYPASYDLDNILGVAAIDSADQLASFSNYGAGAVDLGAPGVSILSTVLGGGYGSYNGTSMAAPHVTGVVALVYGLHPGWSYGAIRDQILATTWAVPALLGRTLTGGVVNAGDAVGVENPGPVPTPGPTPIPPPTPTPSPFNAPASAEITVEGRIRGSYKDTWMNDTAVETITERSTTGSPSTRVEGLEHIWQFYVPTGRSEIVFRVDAWAPPSGDKDRMIFDYSTDRANWTPMFVLAQTTESNSVQEYVLPASVGGKTVYVRVRDSDRTVGTWKSADTIYVDNMVIRCTAR